MTSFFYRPILLAGLGVGLSFSLSCGLSSEKQDRPTPPSYDPHFQNKHGSSHLMGAAFHGDLPLMADLIKRGANVDLADQDGQTALHQAVIADQAAAVAFLLEHKASVNVVDKSGFSPLMYAASKSGLLVIDYLITAKADAKTKDPQGWTALMFATSKGSPKMVARLLALDRSVVVEAAKDGATPLDLAVEDRNLPVARLLVEAGANVLSGPKGQSPLDQAARAKLPEMTRLLCAHLPAPPKMKTPPKVCQPR